MRVFISFASEDRLSAERLHFALVGAGFQTFFDHESLPPGSDFNSRIQSAVQRSELFVFLISPDSVASGCYALTELGYARSKWPHPKGRVLPVMLGAVPFPGIPPYLSSVTVLEPVGNPEAEVAQAVASMASALSRRRWLRVAGAGVAALTLAAGAAFVYMHLSGEPGLGGTFAYPNFASLDNLRLLGNAVIRDDDLLLTPAKIYQVGGVWFRRRVNVARGFECTFIYGVERPNPAYGSDGLAFVVQNDRPDAIGSWGGNLGYDGIRKSAAVEFDMIRNLDLGDPNENHVSLQTRFQDGNSANHNHPFSEGFSNPVPVNLSDGSLHTVYITYQPPDWAVYVDDRTNPVVRAKLDLKKVVGSEGFAWVGLTAASGGWAQGHILHSWKLDANSPFE
jgi:hypothetical protein